MTSPVQAYMALSGDAPGPVNDLLQGLHAHQLSILDVVKELGPFLVSETNDQRRLSVQLIATLLGSVSLERTQVSTFVRFMVDKVQEPSALLPAFQSIESLIGMGVGIRDTSLIVDAISTVDVPRLPQPSRLAVYKVIDALLVHNREALKRMGPQFLQVYTASLSNEKDPRNLVVAFAMTRVVLIEFDISQNVLDLFNITFCYFPITFTPPPNDTSGISPDDLVTGLRLCLSATPWFARLAFPLFLDKLQSTSDRAKLQSLQAITACVPVYGSSATREYVVPLLEAIMDSLPGKSDDEKTLASLDALASIFNTLYPEDNEAHMDVDMPAPGEPREDNDSPPPLTPDALVWIVLQAINNDIATLDSSKTSLAIVVLSSLVSSTSPTIANIILSATLPLLLEKARSGVNVEPRSSVLPAYNAIAQLVSTFAEKRTPPAPHLHGKYGSLDLNAVLDISKQGIASHDTRGLCLDMLVSIVYLDPLVVSNTTPDAVQTLLSLLPEISMESAAFIDDAVSAIVDAATCPYINDGLLLKVSSTLLDCALTNSPSMLSFSSIKGTGALSSSLEPRFANPLLLPLISHASTLATEPSALIAESSTLQHYLLSLFACFEGYLLSSSSRLSPDISSAVTEFIWTWIQSIRKARPVTQSPSFQLQVGALARSLVLSCKDSAFYANVVASLKALVPKPEPETLVIYSSLLLPLPRDASLPESPESLVAEVIPFANVDDPTGAAALSLIESIVNKHLPRDATLLSACQDNLLPDNLSTVAAILTAQTSAGQIPFNFLDALVAKLDDSVLAPQIAYVLTLPVAPNDALQKKYHARVSGLYKQRYFGWILPRLAEKFSNQVATEDPDRRSITLSVLASLLEQMPESLSADLLPTVAPLILAGLGLTYHWPVKTKFITAARRLLAVDPRSADSVMFVQRALDSLHEAASKTDDTHRQQLLLALFEFLLFVPQNVPALDMVTVKPAVLRGLKLFLDDSSRTVRGHAAACRARWFLFR